MMNKTKTFLMAIVLGAVGLVLIAMPSHSGTKQDDKKPVIVEDHDVFVSSDDDPVMEEQLVLPFHEGSWLGVETHEVTTEKAKELKLSAEHGVVLGKIVPDSPAAKAGLKEGDVVMDLNGQRVEGTAQFRRMIREIPAGRAVQLNVWRNGRAQTVAVKLGKSEENHANWMKSAPGTFAFHMPEIPAMPEVMEIPGMEQFGFAPGVHARLGIDAENLEGQLAAYFGAPEGEGILVRSVNSGSPAEKAGVKAGDVITSVNGERVRSVGELREKIASKNEAKNVELSVLRNKVETKLNVELPPAPQKQVHVMRHRTNI
jgi:serine protease Do